MLRLLDKVGHAVTVVRNGRDALDALATGAYDMVLMDIQMPEMDGFEVAAIIRARERATGQHLPLVALTAHAMRGDRERCLQAGFDGYVSSRSAFKICSTPSIGWRPPPRPRRQRRPRRHR